MGGGKMTCNFDDMLLYEYLDDLLDVEEKFKVNNHLSACASCRQKLSEIKLMYYELDHLEAVEIPEALSELRASIVDDAFDGKEKVSTLQTISKSLKNTKSVLDRTPVIGTLMPSKKKLATATKHLYDGSKKVVSKVPRKSKKEKQSFKKRIGGLL